VSDGHRTSTIPRPAVEGRSVARSNTNSRGHNKSRRGTPRPVTAAGNGGDHTDGEDRSGLLKDFTRPIPEAKQIVTKARGRLIVGVFAVLIAIAIGAALFVLPVKSWMKQRDTLSTRTAELETLDAANSQLQGEVDRLKTPDGVREAAREEIDYVPAGEKRVTVLPVGPASTALPPGWPYNLVTSIIALRTAEAAAALSPAIPADPAAATTVLAPATTALATTTIQP